MEDRIVAARAEASAVRVIPLSRFSVSAPACGGLVLGYGHIHEDAIDAAVTALTRAIQHGDSSG